MRRKIFFIGVCLLINVSLAACALPGLGGEPAQAKFDAPATQIPATQTPIPTYTPTHTPTPTPTPTPQPTATPTPTPQPPTAADIFARVSPSIAFIETPIGSGSGVLIEDGYIVTNAHVVWPFQAVRVVFPDGLEYLNAPVLSWDLLGDLAVVGPLQTSIKPSALVAREDLIIGSDVFLIGYPGEVEPFPEPTITRGLISRQREWAPLEMTYFQTDATIGGGQSGGVLVSAQGEVIGISGFAFSEARFGLVASAADVLPRVQQLIAAEDVAGLGDRRVSREEGQLEYDVTLRDQWDSHIFVLNEPVGTVVDIEVEGENDAIFGLVDVFGNVLMLADTGSSGVEVASVTTELAAPYFVILSQYSEEPGEFQVSSNCWLVPYDDVDDGTKLAVGQTRLANMDYPGDADYFMIDLAAGETINVTTDSILIDPVLAVGYPDARQEEIVFDDNSGGGLFGLSAELTYQAPHDGRYLIVVGDMIGMGGGGYYLTVTPAATGDSTILTSLDLQTR